MLTLHSHPLSSYCWKVLIGLYEKELPFENVLVDLGNAESRARLEALWPMVKMPVLVDEGRVVPETTIILEYLDLRHPSPVRLLPADPEEALKTRLADRFYDNYLQTPMQKIVGDRIRPADQRDPLGVEEARAALAKACRALEADQEDRPWACGQEFSLADCAAFPALHYANEVMPLGTEHPRLLAYLERLRQRPSVQRVLREAEPYLHLFPR